MEKETESTENEIQVNTNSDAFKEGVDLARKLEVIHAEKSEGASRRL